MIYIVLLIMISGFFYLCFRVHRLVRFYIVEENNRINFLDTEIKSDRKPNDNGNNSEEILEEYFRNYVENT